MGPTLSVAPSPSESMNSMDTFSPEAVRAGMASLHSQMPFVWLAIVCPTENPARSPRSWFMRNDLPERYRPATMTTAAARGGGGGARLG